MSKSEGSIDEARVEDPVRQTLLPGRAVQELWFALARRPWTSTVLVPAEMGDSAAATAAELAEVGRRLRTSPVSVMVADELDYDSVARLLPRVAVPGYISGAARPAGGGQVVVAIPSVITQPLGVAVARVADLVVLCVEVGRTRVASARRTVELIGAERIAGCLLLR